MLGGKKVFKILVTGSFGSGKTTFVRNLSEIDPVTTEKKISRKEEIKGDKDTTTVAMDMGKLRIGDDIEIHLFATPGQERFDFMVDILKRGIIGAVILVDATDPESVKTAEHLIKKISSSYDIPIIVGVTKTDMLNAKSLEEIKALLGDFEDVPVEPVDPRDKRSGKELLIKLLSQL